VTIEPAAIATGAAFHPLEVHDAELWVVAEWLDDRVVKAGLDVVASRRFQQRLLAIGGYDLANCGMRLG
jgi:molybdate-binding protein